MREALLILVPMTSLFLMIVILARLRASKSLTAHRFALVFGIGLCSTVLLFFFLAVGLFALESLNGFIISLGLGIGFLNLALGYLIAYWMFKYILRHWGF